MYLLHLLQYVCRRNEETHKKKTHDEETRVEKMHEKKCLTKKCTTKKWRVRLSLENVKSYLLMGLAINSHFILVFNHSWSSIWFTYRSRRRLKKRAQRNTSGRLTGHSSGRASTDIYAWKSQQTMKTSICERQPGNALKKWSQKLWKPAQQINKNRRKPPPRAKTPIPPQQCNKNCAGLSQKRH